MLNHWADFKLGPEGPPLYATLDYLEAPTDSLIISLDQIEPSPSANSDIKILLSFWKKEPSERNYDA